MDDPTRLRWQYLCVFHCVTYLILPAAVDPRKNILFRNILDSSHGVVVWIIVKYDAEDPVLCLAQPALLEIVKYDLYP